MDRGAVPPQGCRRAVQMQTHSHVHLCICILSQEEQSIHDFRGQSEDQFLKIEFEWLLID